MGATGSNDDSAIDIGSNPTDIVGAGSLTRGTDSTGTAGNDTGAAAATSGGFPAELLSLF